MSAAYFDFKDQSMNLPKADFPLNKLLFLKETVEKYELLTRKTIGQVFLLNNGILPERKILIVDKSSYLNSFVKPAELLRQKS